MSSLACCEPSKRQRTNESSAAGVADLPSPHRPEPANALLPSSFFLCARLRVDVHPVTSCLERTHCGWYRPCKTVKGAMSQRLQVAVYDESCQVRSSPRACHCLFLLRPSSTRRSSTCESLPSPMSRQVKMQAALYSQDLQRVQQLRLSLPMGMSLSRIVSTDIRVTKSTRRGQKVGGESLLFQLVLSSRSWRAWYAWPMFNTMTACLLI